MLICLWVWRLVTLLALVGGLVMLVWSLGLRVAWSSVAIAITRGSHRG